MEIDNAIFQDLESSGKVKIFKMAVESLWILEKIFVWKNCKNVLKLM